MIKCAYINILETSTVSLSAGTEDASCPLYRTYDRNIGRVFKTTAAVTTEIKVVQPAGDIKEIDRLLIPLGHNLDGETLDIKYSDNDADWTSAAGDPVGSWVQSGSGLIDVAFTAATHRYWKFIITSPAAIPELPELFLTKTYEWERDPERPTGAFEDTHNVEHFTLSGGRDVFLEHGLPKQRQGYHMPRCGEAQKDNVLALNTAWAGKNPFWLFDHTGKWIFGHLQKPLDITEVAFQTYSFDFNFIQVLP